MIRYFIPAIILSKALFAQSLSVITVDANQSSDSTEISATKINKAQIENSVTGNGFISSLLDTHSNITVDDSSKNSNTAGEIAPGKISINEAPFYQNNFRIDGISNSSLLDPNLSGAFNPYDVPGNENEIFLDLDLVDSIFVYDSNISAEFGNFTGGVIDAKTIRAKGKFSAKISYKHTSDKLTNLHVSNKKEFEKARTDNQQPRFEKYFWNMYITTPINDSNSMIFSYSKKESIIPGAFFGSFNDKERLSESFFVKNSHYFDDDSVLDVTATYSPYESTHFQEYVQDSLTKVTGGGYSLKGNYEKEFDFWKLDTNLAYKHSQNKKESKNYHKTWIKQGSKDWGPINDSGNDTSIEGGTGNIEKTQNSFEYNAKLTSDEFLLGGLSNKIKTGFDLNFNTGRYNREDDYYIYQKAESNRRIDCNGDTEGCDQSQQYFTERKVYQAEDVEVDMLSTALFLENKLEYGKFELTPGVRFDYNNYLKNPDLAYRLNGSFKPFNNTKTVIYGGFNRYYGKSFLGYKLREARLPHYTEYRSHDRNIVGDWGTSSDKDSQKYVFSDLDTPYTDEKSIGIRQDFFGTRFNLKFVDRQAKNKFSKHQDEYKEFTRPDGLKGYYKPTTFRNEGYSDTQITSLNIGSVKPYDFGTFKLGYKISTSWLDTVSNSDSYDDLLEDDPEDKINKVYYNGKVIDKNDLDISKNPHKYNLHLNFAFKPMDIFGYPTKVNLNNIIRYTAEYDTIEKADDSEKYTHKEPLPDGNEQEYEVPVYGDVTYEDQVTVDLKATFNFKLPKKQTILLTTEVNNIFDEVQNVDSSSTKYRTGRQFWFNIAYKY